MRPRAAAVRENLRIAAAGLLQRVAEDRQVGEQPLLINRLGQVADRPAVDRHPRRIDRRLAASEYVAGPDYTIADMAIWPWYGALVKGLLYEAGEFLSVHEYRHVVRWTDQIASRPAVQRGRMVIELRPRGANKAAAIAGFMEEMPFRDRRPVCLGDDLTDEQAFEWANAMGGYSIAVGAQHESVARAHVGSVRQARAWLRALVSRGARPSRTIGRDVETSG